MKRSFGETEVIELREGHSAMLEQIIEEKKKEEEEASERVT